MLQDKNICSLLFCHPPSALALAPLFRQLWKSVNLLIWTRGCTRPGVRVAMEVKLLMGALWAPRGPKWLKLTKEVEKICTKWAELKIKVRFFCWFDTQAIDLLSSPFLVLFSKGKSSWALPFIPEGDRMNPFSDPFRRSSFAIHTLK